MKIGTGYKMLVITILLGLAVFSGFFVLSDSESDVSDRSGKQVIETIYKENSLKGATNAHESDIIQKVNIQDSPANSRDYWDDSETFTINVKKFNECAARRNINIRLLERDFEIEFDEITVLDEGESYHYSGHVKGMPYSKAEFYIYGEVFCGSIECGDLMYTIAVTSDEYDGKTVHVVFLINWKNEREKIKDLLNPLNLLQVPDSATNLPSADESGNQYTSIDS